MPELDLSRLRIERSAAGAPRPKRRALWIVLALAGLALAALLSGRLAGPLEVQTASVSTAYPYQAVTLLNAAGYVVAQRKAAVASKATGRLEWLGVAEGSAVKAGEIIARLESKDVRAQADQANANVAVARAGILQAEAELKDADSAARRARDLVAKKFLAQSALDQAEARLAKSRAALASTRAALQAAQAAARTAEVAADQTLIRAPFDGVVLTKAANVGDTVTPFSAAMDTRGAVVTMADMATLEVEADVSESNLEKVRPGQPCEIQLDALPDQRFAGEVSRLVPTVDRSKATVMAKVRFVRKDARILPEMSAKVAFLSRPVAAGEEKPSLALDPVAVADRNGGKVVFLMMEGRARQMPVQVGAKLGDLVAVSGVKAGDRIILNPPPGLKDGDSVKQVQK
ncbi:MAG: efflux RND transporter periplasmic adaptor subunit [Rhodocyclaceae bacterium]|nr:efflux RND transporter periplasmic adaptor subunit [Rhodocyclaceae bacterium]